MYHFKFFVRGTENLLEEDVRNTPYELEEMVEKIGNIEKEHDCQIAWSLNA